MFDSLVAADFGNEQQAVDAVIESHKSSELGQAGHSAGEGGADLEN